MPLCEIWAMDESRTDFPLTREEATAILKYLSNDALVYSTNGRKVAVVVRRLEQFLERA